MDLNIAIGEEIHRMKAVNLNNIPHDRKWAFADLKRRETLYATHGYHRYPAKFIPQLVQKLLINYSNAGDIVLDCFGGCGTTLVESKLSSRNSIGLDVNRVAVLIARAKTQAINPEILERHNKKLLNEIHNSNKTKDYYKSANQRLQYWFKRDQYNRLMQLYEVIRRENNNRVRLFYQCCFSNILKTCSIWYSKSIKPMRDLHKKDIDPIKAFGEHLCYMTRKNTEFAALLKSESNEKILCKMKKGDARRLDLPNEYVDLIITSPPYVTSYEYADLHQLSTLWFKFADDIKKIKKDFVGTSSRKRTKKEVCSRIACDTLNRLNRQDKPQAHHVRNYYLDLEKCYKEMYRVLRKNKYLCLIIGNTEYKNVKIPNAEVSMDLLNKIGFSVEHVIKRKLSSKIFTPYRDKTGKFTNPENGNKKKIYQYEYIIISKKVNKSSIQDN